MSFGERIRAGTGSLPINRGGGRNDESGTATSGCRCLLFAAAICALALMPSCGGTVASQKGKQTSDTISSGRAPGPVFTEFSRAAPAKPGTFLYVTSNMNRYGIGVSALGPRAGKIILRRNKRIAFPEWSPDAKKIVFVSGFDKSAEIYVLTVATGRVEQITKNHQDDEVPTWDPAGKSIAFLSKRDGRPELYRYYFETKTLKRLTNNNTEEVSKPVFSPDGSKIALLSRENSPVKHLVLDWISASGGELKRMVPEQERQEDPEWSPDGTEIAFSGFDGTSWQIYTKNIKSGRLRGWTHGGDKVRPTWSPNGKYLTFTGFEDDKWRIGLIRLSDGAAGYVAGGSDMTAGSWFTPDGNHILFSQVNEGNSWDLWLMRADGQKKINLTASKETELFPDWKP